MKSQARKPSKPAPKKKSTRKAPAASDVHVVHHAAAAQLAYLTNSLDRIAAALNRIADAINMPTYLKEDPNAATQLPQELAEPANKVSDVTDRVTKAAEAVRGEVETEEVGEVAEG